MDWHPWRTIRELRLTLEGREKEMADMRVLLKMEREEVERLNRVLSQLTGRPQGSGPPAFRPVIRSMPTYLRGLESKVAKMPAEEQLRRMKKIIQETS